GKRGANMMKTDVKQTDNGYEVAVDLPGCKKEDVQMDLNDGYLYGTGFHGELRPSGLAACGLIRRLHKSGAFVLAVDLPSGINT
ncbi:NAD(P)H-hydrate epimerase, partial [Faecalibacterium duncaniae]|uniref:NAD(P)H-hydrate epimerase n=1 Tax=Faecalibacterium duncaniae (strain DSM 17677 / JCM 31915 / A2-165) TaxID=411483 RepID=UPI0029401768